VVSTILLMSALVITRAGSAVPTPRIMLLIVK
jgi:hypothetical protein